MSKLIKYLIVEVKTGKWKWNDENEHHSIAVPKMLNNLELRKDLLLNEISKMISKGMKENIHNRSKISFSSKINIIKEEINLHFYMLEEFKRKVLDNVESETKVSPIMKLKKMDSPLNKKNRTVSISHMYERYDNDEISSRLEKSQEDLNNTIIVLDNTLEIWDKMLKIYDETDANQILKDMRYIKEKLKSLNDDEIRSSFFTFDDATRGLINKGVNIRVNVKEAFNKIYDLIMRTLIKGVDDYRKSNESMMIEKALDRLKELKVDKDVKTLLEVKILLDTESLKSSYETCYKKIGEMHGSMHQKLFEISGLHFLKQYFSSETILLIDIVNGELKSIHESFIIDEDIDFKNDKNLIVRNISELEIYHKVVSELLLESEPGKEYFHLSNKLHSINSYIASKYYILNLDDMYKCIDVIGSKTFTSFITSCESLMFALRTELEMYKENDLTDVTDELSNSLNKIGITSGKTTMIDTYEKAVEEILASLGTFMGNTIHSLIKEMLQNIPQDEKHIREKLKNTYEVVETALREFNQEE